MSKQIGDSESRYQQGDTADLRSHYRAIGIPALNAAALCRGPKKVPAPQQAQSIPAFDDFQD
jgi:hypothetical protein